MLTNKRRSAEYLAATLLRWQGRADDPTAWNDEQLDQFLADHGWEWVDGRWRYTSTAWPSWWRNTREVAR